MFLRRYKIYLLNSLTITTREQSKQLLLGLALYRCRFSHIQLWFVVNREAYGESLRLFVGTGKNDYFNLIQINMKKYFLCAVMLLLTIGVNAQIMRAEELEKYAKEKYGEKWNDAAKNLASQLQLDKNNALTYTQIIEAPGKTKTQLYVILNYWYSNTFRSGKSVIQLNDKEAGVIIAKGYVDAIAAHAGGTNSYTVNITPIIKTDIKDGKVRVTYTIPFYDVDMMVGGGILGAMGGSRGTLVQENWPVEKCFPFIEKDSHKKTSAKALVMAHAYSNVIMDKIEEAIKNGVVGNENDNW